MINTSDAKLSLLENHYKDLELRGKTECADKLWIKIRKIQINQRRERDLNCEEMAA